MQEPSLASGGEAKELTPETTPAVSTGAVSSTDATDSADDSANETVAVSADAEVEAELLMSNGEKESADDQNVPESDETLMAKAIELMARNAADIGADEIRRLRQRYLLLHKGEGDEEHTAEESGSEFMLIIERLKAKKAAWMAEQEAQRAANLERKNAIIAEINALAEDTDNVNRTFPRYRELQEEFNSIGDVDPIEETSIWKRFQDARERYSDNLKINKELRDYDFKKNLGEKEQLLTEARALAEDEDVIAAYRRLQELHNRWRQIGPVAKDLREEIWNSFREASAEINKRYQAYFEARKAKETENEIAKTAICTQLESIDMSALRTFAAWEDATKKVIELQGQWRTTGAASKKANRQLFSRFRAYCDTFFSAKSEFYHNTRREMTENQARKQQLVERAEALQESTDWRSAGDQFIEMQKE